MIDKTAVNKVRIDQEKNDFKYCAGRSYKDRLDALESIRAEYITWKYNAEQRFQRVYKIIKQE